MSDTTYDVTIIGSGPGGYVAAIRASQLGLKTAIVERGPMGGVCLNIGCIPTKALLHSADLLEEVREGKRFGVIAENVQFNLANAMKHKQTVVKQSSDGVAFLMKKNQVDVYMGQGSVKSPNEVLVQPSEGEAQTLNTRYIILATGARPRSIPNITFDEDRILSSTGMLELTEVPESLLVVGAGAIGVEFASMFRAFGSQVTVVEALPRIVPLEDEEVSAELSKVFQRRRIKVLAGAKLDNVERSDTQVTATVIDADGNPQQITAERMLLGIGITPNTHDIGMEALGIAMNQRGFIEVDSYMRTNVPNIYAIGDCVPTPWLAHVASAEGILVAEDIAGHRVQPINYERIPACTYCNPEIASVGLTEAKAREREYDVSVGTFPFSANGKARILGQSRAGFIKIVAEKQYGEVLGIHMIGPHVTEMISEGGIALSHEATGESMLHTIHAHPTLYEAVGEAVHALVHGSAIHI
ncbi:MAG: dihydrolipoyl dehydrogenase [Chloroflexaceae bacterium]|nr:dihydrolipoyl dehydrogenase [Chloroflexaceae bacterium]